MRNVRSWVGKHDDERIPDRVRLRVFLRYNGVCQCGCTRKITTGERWQIDHKIALINGGENRESNLVPLLLECHKNKTKVDVAEKAFTYRKRRSHYGLKSTKGRAIIGSKRSGWKRKMDGTWERR